MGQRHPLRPVRARSRPCPLRTGPYVVFQQQSGRYPEDQQFSASKGFARSSVGRSAVQPAQSTSVSGWTSPGAYRRRSCAGFSAKRRGIRGSAGVYFHRARAKMEILAQIPSRIALFHNTRSSECLEVLPEEHCRTDRGGDGIRPFPSCRVRKWIRPRSSRGWSSHSGLFSRVSSL